VSEAALRRGKGQPFPPSPTDPAPERWGGELADPAVGLIALMALAVFVGAGGVNAAFGNLIVQLAALAIVAMHFQPSVAFVRTGPRVLLALAAATCLLPLLQLLPLPPSWWQALPGRELVAQSLDLAGGPGWFPISVDRSRTLVAFLGLLAPLTVLALGCTLPPGALVRLQRATIAIGLAAALFGTTHLLDPAWGDLYAAQIPMPGVLVATFADRNAAALFLDCCLLLLMGLPAWPRTAIGRGGVAVAALFLTVCVLLTQSRSGIALLLGPLALLAWRLSARWRQGARPSSRPVVILMAVGVLGVAAIGITAIASSDRVQASMARFGEGDEMRAEMREDARFAAARYWPVGAGMGTFDEVFQIDESLEYVSPRRAGRAHMDYLELAIEAGAIGLALAASWLAWAAWAGWQAVRRRAAWPARAGALIVASIAAQSVLSFPLRNQAMLCVAALAVVLLSRSPTVAVPEKSQ